MSVKPCHECGNQVSTEAKACPHCGAKPKKPTSILNLVLVSLIGFAVIQCTMTSNNTTPRPAKTAEQLASEAADEKRFQMALALARQIKRGMRNPDSFTVENALANDDSTVFCMEYQGQNGFGGMNKEFVVVTASGTSQDVKQWNKHCTRHDMHDVTHIRQVLK